MLGESAIDLKTAYEILNLRPGANAKEVKKAYRALAKTWHPDHFAGQPRMQRQCEEKMKELNLAYEYLHNFVSEKPAWSAPPETPAPTPQPKEPSRAAAPPPQEQPSDYYRTKAPPPRARKRPPQPAFSDSLSTWFSLDPAPVYAPSRATAPIALGPCSVKLGAAFFLPILMASAFFLSSMPPHAIYYAVHRLFVSAAGLYGAHIALTRRFFDLSFVLVFLAMVLNPLLPITFTVGEWTVLNLMTPSFFVYVWWKMCARECLG